jgi:hypothetical protein
MSNAKAMGPGMSQKFSRRQESYEGKLQERPERSTLKEYAPYVHPTRFQFNANTRQPLSDVFSATPRAGPSPFRQAHFEKPVSTFQVAEDQPRPPKPAAQAAKRNTEHQIVTKPILNYAADSGYFGSQWADATQTIDATQPNEPADIHSSLRTASPLPGIVPSLVEDDVVRGRDSDRRTTEASFQSAKEEQTRNLSVEAPSKPESPKPGPGPKEIQTTLRESPLQKRTQKNPSPRKQSPRRPTAVVESPPKVALVEETVSAREDEHLDEAQSPSVGSSPIRPMVRKSSLNFASLPAREPITKKSIGKRVSRTSQLEQSRTSYYGRATGGKSLGNIIQESEHDLEGDETVLNENGQHDTDTDDSSKMLRLHNKTSTQRLQDQISMLGKSQSNARPPSKSIANAGMVQSQTSQPNIASTLHESTQQRPLEPGSPQPRPFAAPGAFPNDEDDFWVGAAKAGLPERSVFSPRAQMIKSHSTDVMEGIHAIDITGGEQFNNPKRGGEKVQMSPFREPAIPERTTSTLGQIKSTSTSVLRSPRKAGESSEHQKLISVSNPNPSTESASSTTPPKSPSRSQRGSPLKAAKDKFSSILKTSRGLFASSAAVSAEAKTATMSPATSRLGFSSQPSFEEVLQNSQAYQAQDIYCKNQNSHHILHSPEKASTRKNRDSIEREERRRDEEARVLREAKEAQKMADQLDKARQKVKEEARIYHLEQERVAAMQKEITARKEEEKLAKASQANVPRVTRSSPHKTKAQLEAEGIAAAATNTDVLPNKDAEMSDIPAIPRPTPSQAAPRSKPQIGRPPAKRPLKPAKEPLTKAKPPTVIRVDTGSQRGHQYHPSTATLAATLQESLSAPAAGSSQGLKHKPSTSSIQRKASTSSFKSAATKALEAAARKKELVSGPCLFLIYP